MAINRAEQNWPDELGHAINESYEHWDQCPECDYIGPTRAAEGVPDQSLRGCPKCGAVFYEF